VGLSSLWHAAWRALLGGVRGRGDASQPHAGPSPPRPVPSPAKPTFPSPAAAAAEGKGRAAPRCRCKAACPERLDNIKHLDSVFGPLGLDSAALDPAKDVVSYRRVYILLRDRPSLRWLCSCMKTWSDDLTKQCIVAKRQSEEHDRVYLSLMPVPEAPLDRPTMGSEKPPPRSKGEGALMRSPCWTVTPPTRPSSPPWARWQRRRSRSASTRKRRLRTPRPRPWGLPSRWLWRRRWGYGASAPSSIARPRKRRGCFPSTPAGRGGWTGGWAGERGNHARVARGHQPPPPGRVPLVHREPPGRRAPVCPVAKPNGSGIRLTAVGAVLRRLMAKVGVIRLCERGTWRKPLRVSCSSAWAFRNGGEGIVHAMRAAVHAQGPEAGMATLKVDCSQCL
jgi:hypothetical protein